MEASLSESQPGCGRCRLRMQSLLQIQHAARPPLKGPATARGQLSTENIYYDTAQLHLKLSHDALYVAMRHTTLLL